MQSILITMDIHGQLLPPQIFKIYSLSHMLKFINGSSCFRKAIAKLGDCPTVLPLELIYIAASAINNEYIKLTWQQHPEMNVGKFEILRSTDAINFIKIASCRKRKY